MTRDATVVWRVAPDHMKDDRQALLAWVIYQVTVTRRETIDAIAPRQLLSCRGQVLHAWGERKKKKNGLHRH